MKIRFVPYQCCTSGVINHNISSTTLPFLSYSHFSQLEKWDVKIPSFYHFKIQYKFTKYLIAMQPCDFSAQISKGLHYHTSL